MSHKVNATSMPRSNYTVNREYVAESNLTIFFKDDVWFRLRQVILLWLGVNQHVGTSGLAYVFLILTAYI